MPIEISILIVILCIVMIVIFYIGNRKPTCKDCLCYNSKCKDCRTKIEYCKRCLTFKQHLPIGDCQILNKNLKIAENILKESKQLRKEFGGES